MEEQPIDTKFIINHWITISDNDYGAMIDLYDSKRYNWALFIGHLVIEKLLKACYVMHNKEHPILTHNLLKLALQSGIDVNDELQLQLVTITSFNINARYDDYKMAFYKKCTPEYADEWLNQIKVLRLWIKKQYLS